MELFEVKDDNVTFSPIALTLKPFRALWDRDKTKGKKKAIAELAAVYFYADFKSDFGDILDQEEKREVIASFVIGLKNDWEPDEKFDTAVEFYKERRNTVSTVLLDDAKGAVGKISKFLRDVDLQETDDQGKFIYDIKKVNDVIGTLPKTLETLASLDKVVKKEIQSSDQMRGGHQKAIYEDGA